MLTLAAPVLTLPAPVLTLPAPVLTLPMHVLTLPAPVLTLPVPVLTLMAPVLTLPVPVLTLPVPVLTLPVSVEVTGVLNHYVLVMCFFVFGHLMHVFVTLFISFLFTAWYYDFLNMTVEFMLKINLKLFFAFINCIE